jgi:hypothetical protein
LEELIMADEKEREKLTDEELEAQIGAALPDRDVMSILPVPDLAANVPIGYPLDQLDPDADGQEDEGGEDGSS